MTDRTFERKKYNKRKNLEESYCRYTSEGLKKHMLDFLYGIW